MWNQFQYADHNRRLVRKLFGFLKFDTTSFRRNWCVMGYYENLDWIKASRNDHKMLSPK
jgi:hypothetical protein